MIKLLFRNKYLYFGAKIVCFCHRQDQEWMSPINLFHLRCLICCSSCSACPSPPRTTPSRPSGLLGRCGAQRWMDLFFGQIFRNAYFFSGPVPDHRDSPRLHLHPGPDVSWQVITLTTRNKILSWNISISVLCPKGILFYYPGRSFHFPSTLRSYIKIINLSR